MTSKNLAKLKKKNNNKINNHELPKVYWQILKYASKTNLNWFSRTSQKLKKRKENNNKNQK